MGSVNRSLSQREQIREFVEHMRENQKFQGAIGNRVGEIDSRLAALELAVIEQQNELDERLAAQARHAVLIANLYVLAIEWRPWRRRRARRELRRLFSGGTK